MAENRQFIKGTDPFNYAKDNMMIPTKKQWTSWSLPSKYAAIGILLGVLGLVFYSYDKVVEYKNRVSHEWYVGTWQVDINKTKFIIPDEVEFKKELKSHRIEEKINKSLIHIKYVFKEGYGTIFGEGILEKNKETYDNGTTNTYFESMAFVNLKIIPISKYSAIVKQTKGELHTPEDQRKVEASDSELTFDESNGLMIKHFVNLQSCKNCDPVVPTGNEKVKNVLVPLVIYLKKI